MSGNLIVDSGNTVLDEKIKEWLLWDKNESTLKDIKDLLKKGNYENLEKILLHRLRFGTAGLRGRMEAGYAAMNDLVILQTGQGILRYLENADRVSLKEKGIVVGYDGRHNSKRWAEITAAIFLHAGYPVRLFGEVVPTPFVSFATRKFNCIVGVVITASHNPKEDNGYKVFGSNGAQIISPVDKDIQKSIMNNLKPMESSWDVSVLQISKLLKDPLKEVLTDYLKCIEDTILPQHREINQKNSVLFTYSAMHGVGYKYIKEVFDLIGVKFVAVEEQKDPHPDFPTVKFPNPEEGKSSLDLSFKTADKHSSKIIIANDPDADRLAVAEKNSTWKVFTGNELGALLGWWCLYCFKTKYPQESLDDVYMFSSTVSSMILKSMAKIEGFNFEETLTGFKWMGNRIAALQKENKKCIFAFEEAIGFLCGDDVLDKDGISAAFQMACLTSFLYNQKKTLADKLEEIYNTYGYHVSLNSYFICHDQEKIKRIFERIRNFSGENTYPTSILNNKYQIKNIRDLTTGYDNNQPDNKAILPVSSSTQMITFNFTNGLVCTLRTSGTEPKIKYYSEFCADPKQSSNKELIHSTLKEMVEGLIEEFLQPKLNQLKAKSD